MNKRLKARWVKALRSGDYKQGGGQLCMNHGTTDAEYCCLGVLAEIALPRVDWNMGFLDDRQCQLVGLPPKPCYEDADTVREARNFSTQLKLAVRNDTGWSFKRIATWIEKHV